ncbi:MAG: ImmA/IrrE family metallo-endopeptidase [Ruminococcaceae bacterium]|nr:ImmA/IrrE family metallo-endopeptidase [Oscillospiraceae bacterium]
MKFIMREEFKIAYEKADEVLARIGYKRQEMISTSTVINAVEEMLGVDVKFTDFDFKKLSKNCKVDFDDYGAAMCVSGDEGARKAVILLNERETPEMKRFSLVHELGHLMTQNYVNNGGYQVSTHIDMDITSIPDEILDQQSNKFLIDEQVANIFALLVLIPYDMLCTALGEVAKKKKTIEEVADFFGVEISALFSRLKLAEA